MPRNLVAKLTRSTNQIGKVALNGVSDAATPEEIRNYAMLFGKLFPDRVQWEAPEQTASAITIVDNLFNKATSVEPGAKVKLVSGLLGDRSPKPLFKQTVKLPAKGTKIFAILTHLLSNPGSTVTEMSQAYGFHPELTRSFSRAYSALLDRARNLSNLRGGTEVWCYSLKPEVAEAMREALKV
jgi:hypothetical protein